MHDAAIDTDLVLEYCQAILNVDSEEEIEPIKEAIANGMRAYGTSEEVVESYMSCIDSVVENVENGVYVFNSEGHLLVKGEDVQEVLDSKAPEANDIPSQANTLAGVSLGVVTAAIVASIALKKKVLKNKKSKTI